jgi:hypothetical protein
MSGYGRNPMKQTGLALLLVAFASSAAAQPGGGVTVGNYRRAFDRNSSGTVADASWAVYLHAYIEGFGNGLILSNGILALQDRAPAVCVPEGLKLGFDNYKSLIDHQIEEWSKPNPLSDDTKIEAVLVAAFEKAFRCPKAPTTRK